MMPSQYCGVDVSATLQFSCQFYNPKYSPPKVEYINLHETRAHPYIHGCTEQDRTAYAMHFHFTNFPMKIAQRNQCQSLCQCPLNIHWVRRFVHRFSTNDINYRVVKYIIISSPPPVIVLFKSATKVFSVVFGWTGCSLEWRRKT